MFLRILAYLKAYSPLMAKSPIMLFVFSLKKPNTNTMWENDYSIIDFKQKAVIIHNHLLCLKLLRVIDQGDYDGTQSSL